MSEPLLGARGLRVVREGDAGPIAVLDGIDLSLMAGEVLDLSGPSGSGKTTLLRALAWMLPSVAGDLRLSGRSAAEWGSRAWRSEVALLPQQAVVLPGSVRDNVLLPWTLRLRSDRRSPSDADLRSELDSVGLCEIGLERDAARLSVGQAARVALVRVILTGPRVLLLDEPDASLDEESAAQVGATTARFAESGGGVIRARHARPDAVGARRMRLGQGCLSEVADGC